MDEIGARIVADAALTQAHRRLADLGEFAARHVQVDGHGAHVIAVPRHTRTAPAQSGVRDRRAVAGDNLERFVGLQPRIQAVQHVEAVAVDLLYLVGAMVAEDVVDLAERFADVLPVLPVDRLQLFAGVQVGEADRAYPPARYDGSAGRGAGGAGEGGDRTRCQRGSFNDGKTRAAAHGRDE